VVPETCWASNKICNKNHLLHLVGILFSHIIDDSRSKPHQICLVFIQRRIGSLTSKTSVIANVTRKTFSEVCPRLLRIIKYINLFRQIHNIYSDIRTIKNSATCYGSLSHHQAKYKTWYWYIQCVRTLWYHILFINYTDINNLLTVWDPIVYALTEWPVLCFVFGLMMAKWAETCRRIFNSSNINYYICCAIDGIN
jgi:hypothetical protein